MGKYLEKSDGRAKDGLVVIEGAEIAVPVVEVIEALETVEPQLLHIPEEDIIRMFITPSVAMARGIRLHENATRDRDRFVEMFTKPPLDAIDSLRTRALAVKGAELVSEEVVEMPDFEKARRVRARHITVLQAIMHGVKPAEEKIIRLFPGRGYADTGDDLVAIAALEREHWAAIERTGLIRGFEVEEAERLGLEVLRWNESRFEKKRGKDLTRRALTYLFQAYDVVRDHACLIYREEPETWSEDYPNLFAPGPVSYSSDKDRDEDKEGGTTEEPDPERSDASAPPPAEPPAPPVP